MKDKDVLLAVRNKVAEAHGQDNWKELVCNFSLERFQEVQKEVEEQYYKEEKRLADEAEEARKKELMKKPQLTMGFEDSK